MRPVTCEDQTPASMVFTDYTTDEDQDEACAQDAKYSRQTAMSLRSKCRPRSVRRRGYSRLLTFILSLLLVKIVMIARIALKPNCSLYIGLARRKRFLLYEMPLVLSCSKWRSFQQG